jgi:hypothetical protein
MVLIRRDDNALHALNCHKQSQIFSQTLQGRCDYTPRKWRDSGSD